MAVVGAALQALHVHGEARGAAAYLLRGFPGAEAQSGPEASHVRHVHEQLLGSLEVSPGYVEVYELLLGGLHGEADAAPGSDGVKP